MPAPATPTIIAPAASEVIYVNPGQVLCCLADTDGTQGESRWQISTTNSFPASSPNLLFDSYYRENDDHAQGDEWIEIWIDKLDLSPGGTFYLSCILRNGSGSSSWATARTLTWAASPLSSATWAGAQ